MDGNERAQGLGLPHGWAGDPTLAAHPEMRGRGFGRLLLNRCLEAASRRGAREHYTAAL
ncbi:MAG: GNAT family N-acetyltransferase [Mesorhizobium sp.]|uniref:GNAT family N-acetyltransferase n=1 Tax=Mesorhizobium sp. TaxID=1871066 RepID=UPI000FE8F370|nr:GNAT family N-acetyltransferase [Mesorhizobium sp.]RWB34707.1 MAG: GNAT family N-acetyltransferase [Mesorhizobium sp.]RWD30161.1 MAG: GNAT family N-acetyltransferase [Mesorhizobium sp.]RWD47213.1 MAG: GNAT family N-acetyltransferase [Mesorhizobium sp.]RWD81730.1 MAG: GNAT family N-acetyltransferase [Mesorhizobium sp.]TIS39684.1 MAG: GNAT family N-acetyltransferase [Mesorhizobium sp.]